MHIAMHACNTFAHQTETACKYTYLLIPSPLGKYIITLQQLSSPLGKWLCVWTLPRKVTVATCWVFQMSAVV